MEGGQDVSEGVGILALLGFDEKFLARCIMRNFATGNLREVVVLVPEPADEFAAARVSNARQSIERLARDYAGVDVEFIEVVRGSFRDAFLKGREAALRIISRRLSITFCLSGGMRYLLVVLIAVALSLPRDHPQVRESRIEVDIESGEGFVTLPLSALRWVSSLDSNELKVMEALWKLGQAPLTRLVEETGLPRSTVWKALNKLEGGGLVERIGKRGGYKALFPPG